jgi:hypothetical protein
VAPAVFPLSELALVDFDGLGDAGQMLHCVLYRGVGQKG